MRLLRNLARRRLRTALTITGITIGIWSLVVFGSMASKISSIVAMGSDYYVLVTHDVEVGAACDRIIRMRDGLVQTMELVDQPTLGSEGEAAA